MFASSYLSNTRLTDDIVVLYSNYLNGANQKTICAAIKLLTLQKNDV